MAAHAVGRHTTMTELRLRPVCCAAMTCVALTRRRQRRRNMVRAFASSNCPVVTTTAMTLYL